MERVSEASGTAVLVCQGRASADGRYAVGRFSDPVARDLLEDVELEIVDQVRDGSVPSDAATRMAWELVRQTGLTVVPRTIAIDDAIRAHRDGQLVVLGAGLDSRAWRMPELAPTTVFEIDHPASQREKVRRMGQRAPLAHRVVEVPLELGRGSLGRALEEAGFDARATSTWVWEGVIPYLTAPVVESTLAEIAAQSPPGSRLILTYQARALGPRVARAAMRLLMRASRVPDPLATEPWRSLWRPAELAGLCRRHGYSVTTDEDLLTLAAELDLPGANPSSLRNGRVAVATRT